MRKILLVLVPCGGLALVPSPLARVCTKRSATMEESSSSSSSTDLDAWAAKYLVKPPNRGLKGENVTRFDKYKARYMGQYNEVDTSYSDMTYDQFASYVSTRTFSFKVGDRVKGTVSSYDGQSRAMIDIGAKQYAVLPLKEATISPDADRIDDVVDLGQSVETEIISDYRDDGMYVVSIKRILYEKAWDKITEWSREDPLFEAPVVHTNRGGAILLVEGLRAFLPGSHMMGQYATEETVGKSILVKFLEVNKEAQKLVVSHKRAIIEHSFDNVKRGDVVEGTVASVKPYGAFVQLEGLSGLLHISQISYDRVVSIADTLREGMPVKCMIIDHDKSNGRIALSTKTLEPEPGDMLRDPQRVFDLAHETAAKYHARIEAERSAREKAAKEMVLGLGDSIIDGLDDDDLDDLDDERLIGDVIEQQQQPEPTNA
ncbi:hypothetical protein CTAYLR_005837 [Chrysophaeum taylorii]|uniref:S1 motif domain-containing protein n=1 Tax=Chrysophaeum taylorii TaxID=2483200 RepID=A0AAD7XNH5_9STRA|nr:hypothetical protein CTAYLR_005837 [Chrysophaeum taylorii]